MVVGSNPAGPTTFPYMKGVPMRGFLKEFKEFVSRGNVMDMAVGIIIGAAFTAIVTSLVSDVVMPIVSLAIGGADFSSLAVTFGTGDNAATLNYGKFIQAIVNFILVAFVVFCLVKAITKAQDRTTSANGKFEEESAVRECPFCKEEIAASATRCPHCTSELPNKAA